MIALDEVDPNFVSSQFVKHLGYIVDGGSISLTTSLPSLSFDDDPEILLD